MSISLPIPSGSSSNVDTDLDVELNETGDFRSEYSEDSGKFCKTSNAFSSSSLCLLLKAVINCQSRCTCIKVQMKWLLKVSPYNTM